MITHYDIKMEMQKLKEVLSVEGVNIPSLLGDAANLLI